jgi:hypothetical protein
LLTICGSSKATFISAAVNNVNVSSSVGLLLCVRDSSSLAFDDARFHGNTGRPLASDLTAVHLHIRNSRFTNNTVYGAAMEGAALHLNGGTGLVQSSIFTGNRGFFRGGAIGLRNNARLTVTSSVLQSNQGEHKDYQQEPQLVPGSNWQGIHHSPCKLVLRALVCDKQLMQQLYSVCHTCDLYFVTLCCYCLHVRRITCS